MDRKWESLESYQKVMRENVWARSLTTPVLIARARRAMRGDEFSQGEQYAPRRRRCRSMLILMGMSAASAYKSDVTPVHVLSPN